MIGQQQLLFSLTCLLVFEKLLWCFLNQFQTILDSVPFCRAKSQNPNRHWKFHFCEILMKFWNFLEWKFKPKTRQHGVRSFRFQLTPADLNYKLNLNTWSNFWPHNNLMNSLDFCHYSRINMNMAQIKYQSVKMAFWNVGVSLSHRQDYP